jgi:hypothetical protein
LATAATRHFWIAPFGRDGAVQPFPAGGRSGGEESSPMTCFVQCRTWSDAPGRRAALSDADMDLEALLASIDLAAIAAL